MRENIGNGWQRICNRCFALMGDNLKYLTANESSLPAKELESGMVMSLQTRGKHGRELFASLRLLHLVWELSDWAQMCSAVPKWTASVIKNCLPHKLGQELLELTSPQIPDLNIIEPV